MTDKLINDISEIEDSHASLRESIEATKELAERADGLLRKCRARAYRARAEQGNHNHAD